MIDFDDQAYTWNANGQLLDDGHRGYAYDHTGRLVAVDDSGVDYAFAYDGFGNRYQESVDGETNTFSLDLLAENPVVLDDEAESYMYGLGRSGGQGTGDWSYGLPDTLGAESQVVNLVEKYNSPAGSIPLETRYLQNLQMVMHLRHSASPASRQSPACSSCGRATMAWL